MVHGLGEPGDGMEDCVCAQEAGLENRARTEVAIRRKMAGQPSLRESSRARANFSRVFHMLDVESGGARALECGGATRCYPMESCGTS